MKATKVIVGMSGGVDSSVTAYLLKKQGYEVIGVTLQLAKADLSSNNVTDNIKDAKAVADVLQLPFYVMNFQDVFKEQVTNYFVSSYLQGTTPNPCVNCNHYVKWEALLKRCQEMDIPYVATGHYANVHLLENGRYTLKRAMNQKDQTYALYKLSQEQLAKTLMPLGVYKKDEIREIASKISLPIAAKPDSQDICFVPDGDYATFIRNQIQNEIPTGNFVDTNGNIIGTHKGIIHYTVGQRKGLGLPLGHPAYVTEIRASSNEVVIGTIEDVKSSIVYANNLNFMAISDITTPIRAFAKIRYNHKGAWCRIEKISADEIKCTFDEPQTGVTKGQSLVFYENDYILGGGTIKGGEK